MIRQSAIHRYTVICQAVISGRRFASVRFRDFASGNAKLGYRHYASYHCRMAVTTGLLTVAEFSRLPQAPGGIRQELHHGQVVEMPPVKMLHTKLQRRLVNLLSAAVNPAAYGVDKEFPFRPAEEYQVWVADVAVFSLSHWKETSDDDYFRGVPESVIEVLSPSNTASEMMAREEICLLHGRQEFWLVDPVRESVKVVNAGGNSILFERSRVLDSRALVNSIAVRDIFAW